jgi:hypothetical protein
MANFSLGLNGRLYIGAALSAIATIATCPLTHADQVKDVKIEAKNATDSYSTRAQNGVTLYAPTTTEYGISFMIKKDITDTVGFTVLQAAFTGRTEVAVFALDGDTATTGSQGPCGNWIVEDFGADEGNDKVIFYNVTLKPSSFVAWLAK